jgi:hypothetical protein
VTPMDFRVRSYEYWPEDELGRTGELYATTFIRGLPAGCKGSWHTDYVRDGVVEHLGSYEHVYQAFAVCESHQRKMIEARKASEEIRRAG